MVSVSVRYLFYQPVDEKIKTWPLRFPAKETPNMGKTLFDWQIVLLLDVKSKYRSISRKFSGVKFFHPSFNQPKPMATPFRIRSINQSKCCIFFRFLFLFCSRVFISRLYGCIALLSHNQYIGQKKYKSLRCLKSVFTYVASSSANSLRRKKVLTGGKSSTLTGPIWLPLHWGGTLLWRTWRHVN